MLHCGVAPGPQSIAELLDSENEQWSVILLSGERIGWAMQSQQIVETSSFESLNSRQAVAIFAVRDL